MGALVTFAKDMEAGQLEKAGKTAIDQANKTIEWASNDIARFKNPTDVQKHLDQQKKGISTVTDLMKDLGKAKGKAREEIKADLKEAIDRLKGHDKDIRQKPQVPESK